MPKSTKEASLKDNKDNTKTAKKSNISSKKVASKKASSKTTSTVKTVKAKTPVSTKTVKDVVSKKTPSEKSLSKTKKVTSTSVKKTTTKSSKKVDVLEYYDLPFRYNQTVVKTLAQTPKTLFVYWDVSDKDRKSYIKKYGENFFNETIPVLIINNKTKNYSFEIEINDFANCWYFNIQDEKCDYLIELGRRVKNHNSIEIPNNYLYIASSNEIESPNGHILFEKEQKILYFRNVKDNTEYSKDIANLQFINYFNRVYKIYELYKVIYKDEEIFDINNPTSTFK